MMNFLSDSVDGNKNYPASDFIANLGKRGFVISNIITESLNLTLRNYLTSLIPSIPASNNRHLNYFTQSLEKYLSIRGHKKINDICNDLLNFPVIQQADHSNLLIDEETFLNNFLFYLACSEAGIHSMITSQCSIVSCISRRSPFFGPVFVRTQQKSYKTFSFSNRLLKNSNFCSLPGPVKLSAELVTVLRRAFKYNSDFDSCFERNYDSAPEAYRSFNDYIWKSLFKNEITKRVAIDEDLTSDLMAIHISNIDSPIHTLLFDYHMRDLFIKTKNEFILSKRNLVINKSSPDFFWYRKGTRLYPVILHGCGKKAKFVLEHDHSELPVLYNAKDIAKALRENVLYVDRFIGYLIRCLLPGIVAVGGTSQQDSIKHYQEIILTCHEIESFLDSHDLQCLSRNDLSKLGGAPLLALNQEEKLTISNLNKNTDLREFSNAFLSKLFCQTIGDFSCANYLLNKFTLKKENYDNRH